MKTILRNIVPAFVLLSTMLTGCVISEETPEVDPTSATDYADLDPTNFTTSQINVALSDAAGTPFSGLKVTLWSASPLAEGEVIFKGITNSNGQLSTEYNVPNHLESVILQLDYIGLPDYLVIPVDQLDEITIRGFDHSFSVLDDALIPNQSQEDDDNAARNSSSARVAATTIETLGTYNSQGTPDYLLEKDIVSSSLLDYINASLPEGKPVPSFHPAYLENNAETELNVLETADVWMTFISEGAGFRNALGFYTYDTDTPPTSPDGIDVLQMGYPNASLSGSGGELVPGDKIYLGKFEAGTSIGFVLIANGWDAATGSIKDYATRYYSDKNLNINETEEFKQHTVTLFDSENELFLIGFEDLYRSGGSSDEDFNDAVFYITANPITAISRENVNPIDKPVDADGDGVNDTYDEFPDDARYAYRYSYPGENSYGTFAFEDQWPKFGDYDFNDLVVDYQYHQLANASNKIVVLQSEYVLKAAGAGFHNGFGIQMDLAPSNVSSVTGNDIYGSLFSFSGNGTEAGQSKAVIVATDDVHASFGRNGLINTSNDVAYITPDTIRVDVTFSSPLASSEMGSAPFNPFMVINQTRGREVHLPGYDPTDLVDENYFGQENDGSDPAAGIYYRSQVGLPWGMNLPISFDYPIEKTDIRDSYNHFNTWAKSSGFSYMDWYTNLAGYRNTEKIYTKR